ncbi:hypothetical protein SAMN02745206_02514 [Desulfacinum infernum DSM 9756]|uniref:Uncharacterized protein n=1 Tax=Desulfacinum infernum DSM 9756 TaxID=1121391 RepID=A0A1M5DVH9_9BACT|nr:hypothetical protein [Desulfacinum infernum]SHF71048.1 hypothetical protein SAMN02745206_02514 [Desulfacinum infernum DSM 9756]
MKGLRRTGMLWLGTSCLIMALCLAGAVHAEAATFRITFKDGNRVEVPYCWEKGATIFFEIPGGVAGIPKTQVARIEEVLASREMSLDETTPRADLYVDAGTKEEEAMVQLVRQAVPQADLEALSPEEAALLLGGTERSPAVAASVRLYRTTVHPKGEFSEWMKLKGDGAVLVVQYLLSGSQDLMNRRFHVLLYDGSDRLLRKQPCQVQELEIPKKLAAKLGLREKLFMVVATLQPDPKIRRYELASATP